MDPIAKELWCEALRSGEFEQTQCSLKLAGLPEWPVGYVAFCCMGVAREIFPGLNKEAFCEHLDSEAEYLLGISHDQQVKLTKLNDKGYSFKEIAEYIEEHF